MHQTVSMQIETRISLHALAIRTSALVYRECCGSRQSLHHSMRAHCFYCLKPSRCCWALLIPCRIFSPSGLACSHHAGRPSRLLFGVVQGRQRSAPLLQTQLHTTPPYKPQARAVSSFSIVSTAHSVSLSVSFPSALPSLAVCCRQAQNMLGEWMVQAGNVGEGPGESSKNLLTVGKLNMSFVFVGLWRVMSFLAV